MGPRTPGKCPGSSAAVHTSGSSTQATQQSCDSSAMPHEVRPKWLLLPSTKSHSAISRRGPPGNAGRVTLNGGAGVEGDSVNRVPVGDSAAPPWLFRGQSASRKKTVFSAIVPSRRHQEYQVARSSSPRPFPQSLSFRRTENPAKGRTSDTSF